MNCGMLITPTGPPWENLCGCEGTVTYNWNYADCEGNNPQLGIHLHIEYEDFTMPPDAGSTVECFSDVVIPVRRCL